ncbi:hypothetical protein [Leptospira langatensis]|uniref:hypothetical protein n=1 Tax=Leptospira langatensis TaxID=2484983 RepID=UPI001FEBE6C6|nr:hypothetical protein [Leptospira langatensis]
MSLATQFILLLCELFLKIFQYFYDPLRNLSIFLTGLGLVIGYFYYGGYWSSIANRILPPNPVLVSRSCDDKSTSVGNLEYSVRVVTNVRNTGGSGKVVIEAAIQQGDEQWTKSEMIDMEPHQTTESVIVFDEVSLFDVTPSCSVKVFAYGK